MSLATLQRLARFTSPSARSLSSGRSTRPEQTNLLRRRNDDSSRPVLVRDGRYWLDKLRAVSTEDKSAVFQDVHKVMLHADLYERENERLKVEMRATDPMRMRARLQFSVEEVRRDVMQDMLTFRPIQKPIPKSGRPRWSQLRYDVARKRLELPSREQVVLRVVTRILQAIFEPTLPDRSHGYRMDRTPHTCLFEIRSGVSDYDWSMSGDLRQWLPRIDREILISMLKDKIHDDLFTNIVIRALGAGYFDFEDKPASIIEVPKPIGFSGLLANIYFASFDRAMDTLCEEFEKGAHDVLDAQELDDMKKRIRKSTLLDPPRSTTPHLGYFRYANQFILLGRSINAESLISLIRRRVFQSLAALRIAFDTETLSPRNISVPSDPDGALLRDLPVFLGTSIYTEPSPSGLRRHMRMIAPGRHLVRKLADAGLCDEAGDGLPRFSWYHHDKDTIAQLYNASISQLLNYYSFVDNYDSLTPRLLYLMRSSCSKLLAAKFKLRSRAKVYKRWGKDLGRDSTVALDLRPSNDRPHGHFQKATFFDTPNRWFL